MPQQAALSLPRCFMKLSLPKGVLNVVTNGPGRSGEIGDEFIENPKVRRINLTGSSAVGRQLAEKAGRYLKRVALEFSGTNPMVILRDADINAVNAAAFGGFLHQGQICIVYWRHRRKADRPGIHRQIRKESLVLQSGQPKRTDATLVPLSNQTQLDLVKKSVEAAVRDGAKIMYRGKYEGPCYYPTILTNAKLGTPFSCEETFGPVVSVIEVKDEEEALTVANDTMYGLSASVLAGRFSKRIIHCRAN